MGRMAIKEGKVRIIRLNNSVNQFKIEWNEKWLFFEIGFSILEKPAQHALAGDGSTGGKKSRRQSRFPRCTAAEVLYNGKAHGGGWLGAPEALAVRRLN
jgi:hypothetical protein